MILSVVQIVHIPKKYQNHVPFRFAYKLVCADNKFSKKLSCTEEMLFMDILNQFLMRTIIVGK